MSIRSEMLSGILVLTISRPKAMNALNRDVLDHLRLELQQAANDKAVQVIVITGEGDKAFAAGADISEFAHLDDQAEATRAAAYAQDTFAMIEKTPKPVIAAINGYALGGGLELALSCDIRFASERAKLGFPEVTLGILPGFGGTQRAVRLLGRGMANYLIMSGQMISAEESRANGMIEKLVAHDELMSAVLEFAGKLVKLPPRALAAIKDSIRSGEGLTLAAGLKLEAEHFGQLMMSRDGREGIRAFLEKRQAEFNGE